MAAMASGKLRAAASSSGNLPLDALIEILLRLSAKELCRLRAVSPTWRSLTYDRAFIAAHMARHREPLLAFARRGENHTHSVDLVDLSGELVRRMPWSTDGIGVLGTRLELVCVASRYQHMALWVLNPATGAALALPQCHSEYMGNGPDGRFSYGYGHVERYAFGRVSTTGEYKALRITRDFPGNPKDKFCEVITIDADGSSHGVWREMQRPPSLICRGDAVSRDSSTSDEMKCVVVDGVVHFMIDFKSIYLNSMGISVEPGSIVSFNLETEEWMPTLRGPAPVRSFLQDNIGKYSYLDLDMQLSLSDLHGSLVTVHNIHYSSMDLWFLSDFEKGLWVKKYSLPSQVAGLLVYPLLVLDDERVLLMHGTDGIVCLGLRIGVYTYDLKTGAYTHELDLEMGSYDWGKSIGIYTGSLLSP
ncbi:unnamed protein product [Urochloa humidicola]